MTDIFIPKYGWSKSSRSRLLTCDVRLQLVMNKVICHHDCTILCGHRGKEDQNEAYCEGYSEVPWPLGKHNPDPSLAVDTVPCPVNWELWNEDQSELYYFAGIVLSTGWDMGIELKWGGRFKKIFDGPHFELIE